MFGAGIAAVMAYMKENGMEMSQRWPCGCPMTAHGIEIVDGCSRQKSPWIVSEGIAATKASKPGAVTWVSNWVPNASITVATEDVLAQRNAAWDEIAKLKAQLPAEMQGCTIRARECELGHAWLTATNWVQHECPACHSAALAQERDQVSADIEVYKEANSYLQACVANLPNTQRVKSMLDEKDAEITLLRQALAAKDARIGELKSELVTRPPQAALSFVQSGKEVRPHASCVDGSLHIVCHVDGRFGVWTWFPKDGHGGRWQWIDPTSPLDDHLNGYSGVEGHGTGPEHAYVDGWRYVRPATLTAFEDPDAKPPPAPGFLTAIRRGNKASVGFPTKPGDMPRSNE